MLEIKTNNSKSEDSKNSIYVGYRKQRYKNK
jgi:hypothetical protein